MTASAPQTFLDAIPMPAVLIGPDARIRAANAGAVALNARAGEGGSYILAYRQPALTRAIEACLRTRAPQTCSYVHAQSSHDAQYEVSCRYVEGMDLQGVLACFQDVTHVEQVGEMRRDFVANVSHELRTPLTAVTGFIETLRGPARDDAAARDRFLGIMEAETARMNRLVGDLLSLSRVEEYARVRPQTSVDVAALLDSVVRTLRPMAEKTGVQLALVDGSGDTTVPGDADQITQVFTNLIENAIKYGGRGAAVTVTISDVARDPVLRQEAVRIDIADTGPGIESVHVPRLTERFYRIDAHRSRQMGGTGLGLAIVKHILNRHRGRLKIESRVGQGSCFSVFLPRTL